MRASTSTQLEIAEATQISDWDPRSLIRAHVVSKEKKQKIQRLKRQRRQIGKKKKRKRISPRSLWLRFNLYDRFLKKLPRSPIGSYSPKPKGHWLQSEIAYPKGLLQQGPFPSRQRGCLLKPSYLKKQATPTRLSPDLRLGALALHPSAAEAAPSLFNIPKRLPRSNSMQRLQQSPKRDMTKPCWVTGCFLF